ncbi:MAG: oligosaccharide flippase family protein [Patescibacteria group bacterium]|jgi:O-antigen/teichoic acid export membrane protein
MEKKFLINFSALNVSAFINKVFSFVFVVALVRLVSQSDYGTYTLIWAHVGILASWQDLGTTSVGMLQTDKNNNSSLHSLLVLRLFLALAVSLGTIILALLFRYPPTTLLIILCFSAVIFSNAVSGFFLIITSIKQRLTVTSVLSILFNFVLVAFSILTLLSTKNVYIMLFITTLIYGLYAVVLLIVTHRYFFPLSLTWNAAEVKRLIKRSFVFSLIGFFASLPSRSDFLLLAKFGGKTSLAEYAAAFNFFEASLMLVSSYNIASLPSLTKYFKEDLPMFYRKIKSDFIFLTIVSISAVSATVIVGGPLIRLFFSSKYQVAIPILNLLILALPSILFTSLWLNALYAMSKEKYIVLFFAFQAVLHVIVNTLYIPQYSYFAPTIVLVVGEVIQTLSLACYLFCNISHVPRRN